MSLKGDLAAMHRDLTAAGWQLTRTGAGHIKCTAPDGTFTFSSTTPSDWRGLRNFRARVNRIDPNAFGKAETMILPRAPLYLSVGKLNNKFWFKVMLTPDTVKRFLPEGTQPSNVYFSLDGDGQSGLVMKLVGREGGRKLCQPDASASALRTVYFEPRPYGLMESQVFPKPVKDVEIAKGRITIKRVPAELRAKPEKIAAAAADAAQQAPIQAQANGAQAPTVPAPSKESISEHLKQAAAGLGIVGEILLLVDMLNERIDAAKEEGLTVTISDGEGGYRPNVSYPPRLREAAPPQPRSRTEADARMVINDLRH